MLPVGAYVMAVYRRPHQFAAPIVWICRSEAGGARMAILRLRRYVSPATAGIDTAAADAKWLESSRRMHFFWILSTHSSPAQQRPRANGHCWRRLLVGTKIYAQRGAPRRCRTYVRLHQKSSSRHSLAKANSSDLVRFKNIFVAFLPRQFAAIRILDTMTLPDSIRPHKDNWDEVMLDATK
jgi:hypothetical protein